MWAIPLLGGDLSDQDGWGLRSNLIGRGIFEDFHAGSKGNLYSKIETPRFFNANLSSPSKERNRKDDLYHLSRCHAYQWRVRGFNQMAALADNGHYPIPMQH